MTDAPVTDLMRPDVEAVLAGTGMAASRFGMLALGDPRFVRDLRDGREVKRATRQKVVEFMVAWRAQSQGGRE